MNATSRFGMFMQALWLLRWYVQVKRHDFQLEFLGLRLVASLQVVIQLVSTPVTNGGDMVTLVSLGACGPSMRRRWDQENKGVGWGWNISREFG